MPDSQTLTPVSALSESLTGLQPDSLGTLFSSATLFRSLTLFGGVTLSLSAASVMTESLSPL